MTEVEPEEVERIISRPKAYCIGKTGNKDGGKPLGPFILTPREETNTLHSD